MLDSYSKGFEYSDCRADDSRLTILNAVDAKKLGADIYTRTFVSKIDQIDNIWEIQTTNSLSGESHTVKAKIVINATGPWVDTFLKDSYEKSSDKNIRLVKGSHIVLKKIFNHDYSYIFQNADGRIFFAIPWEDEFTFIGTTDVDFNEDIDNILISKDEVSYIIESANEYFNNKISIGDVISSWSGVRPLFENGGKKAQKVSRDYVIREDSRVDDSALVNVFGGRGVYPPYLKKHKLQPGRIFNLFVHI